MKINRRPAGGVLEALADALTSHGVTLSMVESVDLTAEEYERLTVELGVADQVGIGGVLGSIQGIKLLVDGRSPLDSRGGIVVPGGQGPPTH